MNDLSQYENSLKKLIPWIIEQIDKRPYKIIRVKVKDIVQNLKKYLKPNYIGFKICPL